MPIVNVTHEQFPQPDGRTHNVVRLYDQDAREYTQTYWAPAGFDHAGMLSRLTTDMDEQLKSDEFERLFGAD